MSSVDQQSMLDGLAEKLRASIVRDLWEHLYHLAITANWYERTRRMTDPSDYWYYPRSEYGTEHWYRFEVIARYDGPGRQAFVKVEIYPRKRYEKCGDLRV